MDREKEEEGSLSHTVPYSRYFSRGVYFADFAERAQFANFETSKFSGCGQLECSLLPCG